MITLLSLNIQRDYNFDRVTALVAKLDPDVICFQEALLPFVEEFAREFGYGHLFSLRTYGENDQANAPLPEGIALLWKQDELCLVKQGDHHYNDNDAIFPEASPNAVRRALLLGTFEHGDVVYRVGTTHFTWTPDGSASDEQHRDMKNLLTALESYHDEHGVIFTGDFNAPRGGEVFAQ